MQQDEMRIYGNGSSTRDIGNKSLLTINLIGLLLSVYAYHVSVSKRAEPNYRALCDLSPAMSCSTVLTSPYSTGFGIMRYFVDESSAWNATNSAVGIFYYLIFALLSFCNNSLVCKCQFVLTVISNLGSVYLAAVLIILRDVCFVCVSTYFINALNYLFLSRKLEALNENYKVIKCN
ncbi:vitamin K epoxide reductase complex subunit 1-like protein 1 [Planococcus citri]|uniref:vitamin K epoxide reductase complex subunit 1-like protein 1 n=1 Tax=Planococcus citri TaxID=170843 RepID=UPI0031F74B4C